MMQDDVDVIMQIMGAAFDPAFGEAWNRRQVSDALLLGNCRYLLAATDGNPWSADGQQGKEAAGFALSRQAADEEELLLLAVRPEMRGRGIGGSLIERLARTASGNNVTKLFLEMRHGNEAENLYRSHGFEPIGRRPGYYFRSDGSRVDAITFARVL